MSNRSGRFAVGAVTAFGLFALIASPPASATINGSCSASISGQDVGSRGTGATSDAIVVSQHTGVPVRMASGAPISHLKVQLEFGGFRWTVHDEPTTGTSWQRNVAVDRYATYGVGLYKVIGESSAAGGSCSGAALVRVDGNPLSTWAGGGAAGLTALALVSIAGISLAAARGARSRLAPVAALIGLIGGLGAGVLLQQYAILYPTRTVAIVELLAGLAVGALLPGALHVFRARHVSARRPPIVGQTPPAAA